MSLKKTLVFASIAAAMPVLYAADAKPKQITWTFDRLDKIGGVATTVEGHPKIIDSPVGKAVEFDGVGVERETFGQQGERFVVATFVVELMGMIIEIVGTSEAFRHAGALLE